MAIAWIWVNFYKWPGAFLSTTSILIVNVLTSTNVGLFLNQECSVGCEILWRFMFIPNRIQHLHAVTLQSNAAQLIEESRMGNEKH